MAWNSAVSVKDMRECMSFADFIQTPSKDLYVSRSFFFCALRKYPSLF